MLCRLCILECAVEEEIDVFNDRDETNLNNLIFKYLHLVIAQDDGISTKICSNCAQHLKDFHEFFHHIKERQNVVELIFLERLEANENEIQQHDESFVNVAYADHDVKARIESLEFVAAVKSENLTSGVNPQKENRQEGKSLTHKVHRNLSEVEKGLVKRDDQMKTENYIFKKSQLELTDEKDKFIEEHVQLKCKICRTILTTFKDFQRHFREKHESAAYIKCCGVRLYSRQRMVKHIQTHVNPDLFKCQVCNKVLSGPKNLESHIASFHTDKEKLQHACEICGDRFTTSFILRTHMIVHQEGNEVTCEICNKSFKHLRSAKRHKRLQHGTISYHVCELCGKSYKYKQIFEQHMADKHNIISKDTMQYCAECRSWFSTKYYSKHAKRHELKDVPCKHCGKMCPSKAALDKHLDGHYHKKKCHTCGINFDFAKELRDHLKTHTS